MKQRLGVAAALLKDPELLILDEPTNGLDPAGMAEMRDADPLARAGERTVVLSSHLMGEVEQIADRVGVIRAGALVAEGTVAELRGRAGLRVRAQPLAGARDLLALQPGVEAVREAGGRFRSPPIRGLAAELNHALVTAGVAVSELTTEQTRWRTCSSR